MVGVPHASEVEFDLVLSEAALDSFCVDVVVVSSLMSCVLRRVANV